MIPESVTSIGDYAFAGTGLTTLTIPESVTTIGESEFYNCTNLTNVLISSGVTSIGDYAFYDCISLTGVTIPASVTNIGDYVFFGCTGLTILPLASGVQSIGYGEFEACTGLTSVTLPASATNMGDGAFYGCTSLTNVTLASGVQSIGNGEFNGCSKLVSISIPASVTNIGGGAFEGCAGLTTLTIPNGVPGIGAEAFRGCSSLASITIAASVTGIGEDAFEGCTSLASVYFQGNAPAYIDPTAFEGDTMATFYYLAGTTGWSSPFAGRPAVLISTVMLTWSNPAAITYGTALNSAQLNATANMPGDFAYSPTNGAGLNAGTNFLSVIFSPTDTNGYGSLTDTVSVVVLKAAPLVNWPGPSPIIYGTALNSNQLDATANVPGTFAYTPPAGPVLNAGTNTVSVIFTPADAVDYSSVTDHVSLVVTPASLTVTAANAARAYGQTNPMFEGTMTGLQNGDNITATYSCSATSNSPVGTYSIVPSLMDPNNRQTNYTVSLINGLLTIGTSGTILSWGAPSPILYGTGLSASQLNAVANVPGNFAYNPPPGTVLNSGANTLSAIFTPTDTVDYSSVTDHVSLVVSPAPLTVTAANASRAYGQTNPVFMGNVVRIH